MVRDGGRGGAGGRREGGGARRKEIGEFSKTRGYTLRVEGPDARGGEIPKAALTKVVGAMQRLAERVTRLRATGISTARGARPKWLEETLTFAITGFGAGSIGFRAPRLVETAGDRFGRPSLREGREQMDLEDTALDLVGDAVRSVTGESEVEAGMYDDGGVLEAMLAFGRANGNPDAGYALTPDEAGGRGFAWDRASSARAEARLGMLPPARGFIVTGRLDSIEHDDGRFLLRLKDGSFLRGQLDAGAVDREVLRSLRGTDATVTGVVHFRADGSPRAMLAQHMMSRVDRHEAFDRPPRGHVPGAATIPPEVVERARNFDWDALKGAWPGDETIEELLAELAELRSVR